MSNLIFHGPTGRLTFDVKSMEIAVSYFMYSLEHIKKMAGVPLTPYEREGPLEHRDHAMKGIIDGAAAMGIDLGKRWGNEIDNS
jgi:hypothetical protein